MDCNDGNTCTTECCSDARIYYHDPVVGCCKTAADYNGADACTADACVAGQCKHKASSDPLCCDADSDCSSGDICQPAFCATITMTTLSGVGANAQASSDKKGVTKPITVRRCKVGPGIPGCCSTDKACDYGNACTQDARQDNQCIHASIKGCCPGPSDCNDGNRCTLDGCKAGKCFHQLTPGEAGSVAMRWSVKTISGFWRSCEDRS